MIFLIRYYFEGNAPSLEEVCEKIKQEYDGNVKYECSSDVWEWDKDEVEDEEEHKLKKFHEDFLGANKWPMTINSSQLSCDGEVISLHSYTCKQPHIDLRSHHQTKTHNLFEFAGTVIENMGGKPREITEKEQERLKKVAIKGYMTFLCMVIFVLLLYFKFEFSVLQIFLILLGMYILKTIYECIHAYRMGKKQGWL